MSAKPRRVFRPNFPEVTSQVGRQNARLAHKGEYSLPRPKRAMDNLTPEWSMTMRADKDYKTDEQALTIVQRLGELAEADHKKGKHQDAQYHLSHATFVGVKHLLFMAADAAVDRAEARQLASKNHLEMIELLSLTLVSLGYDGDDGGKEDKMPSARAPKGQRRSAGLNGKAIKAAKVDDSSGVKAPTQSRTSGNSAIPRKKSKLRERRP